MPNGDLIVGGGFNMAGSVTCHRIARWDGNAWSPLGSGMDWWVQTLLALPNGDLIAGGGFLTAGGTASNFIARWDGSAWSPLGSGMDGTVASLSLLPNGDVLAGGSFQMAGGNAIKGMARWDGSSWSDVGSFTFGGTVRDFAQRRDGTLAVAGHFLLVDDDEVSAHFARLESTCPASAATIPTSCVGPRGPVTLTADTLPWVGSTFASTAAGFQPNSLAVSLLGLTSPNVPLSWLWSNTLPNCNQLASQEAILLTLPQNGMSSYSFAIPNSVVFAGLPLFHQFLQFEVNAQNQLGSLSGSNALALTIGTF